MFEMRMDDTRNPTPSNRYLNKKNNNNKKMIHGCKIKP